MFFKNRIFYEAPEDKGGGTPNADTTPPGSMDTSNIQETEAEKRMKAMEATIAKISSNFDRKNTEFQKLKEENEELKKAQMKESERQEYEKQQYQKQLEERENAIKRKEFELQRVKVMSEKGISQELGNLISGGTVEEYQKNIEIVTSQIEEEVKKRVEKAINEKLGGAKPPASGDGGNLTGKALLIQQYNEAEKKGDALLMLRLQDQIKHCKE